MDAAHSAKDNNGFSNHARADVSLDAFMSRVNAHVELIEKRGRFQHEEASLAVVNRAWETKERCALWLRTELKSLRQGEARIGAAPIRNRLALSRIKIADLAVMMLECLFVGDNLLRLFQELLNVDRHREELGTRDARLEPHKLRLNSPFKDCHVECRSSPKWYRYDRARSLAGAALINIAKGLSSIDASGRAHCAAIILKRSSWSTVC